MFYGQLFVLEDSHPFDPHFSARRCSDIGAPKRTSQRSSCMDHMANSVSKKMAPAQEDVQGPLGKPYAKPTTFAIGHLQNLPKALFRAYQPGGRPSMVLGGKDQQGRWRTSEAKQYPSELCRVLAQEVASYVHSIQQEGDEANPADLEDALQKLVYNWDPYIDECQNMRSNFQLESSR